MWIPKTAKELRDLVENGHVSESATLDFKEGLSSNKEIAKDLAAMSTDGGVIIYGVAEDKNRRPTIPSPISLSGQPERITSIAGSSIHEPLVVSISTIVDGSDPSCGYLIVQIPPSPRAPHMVQVGGDNRYYGRNGCTNRKLTEGEVARLYARRESWEKDREHLLDSAIAQSPFEPDPRFGYLHIFSEPVAASENLLDIALGPVNQQGREIAQLLEAAKLHGWTAAHPAFGSGTTRKTSAGWSIFMGDRPEDEHPDRSLNIDLTFGGGSALFCGRSAAEALENHFQSPAPKILFEDHIANWTISYLSLLGVFYDRAAYLGAIDLGVAVTGIEKVISGWKYYEQRQLLQSPLSFPQGLYRSTCRALAVELRQSPASAARQLLRMLFRVTTDGLYSPFDR